MQLGISTYSFPWSFGVPGYAPEKPMQVKDLLAYALSRKIRHVQFGDNCPMHLLSESELEEIRTIVSTNNIQVQVGTRKLQAAHITRYLEIAQQFRSPFLRVVIDDEGFHPDAGQVISIVHELLPLLEASGIRLAIENHDRFPAKVLQEIVLATNPELVGICLDTANSLGAGEGICEIMPLLLPHTLNIHIKDFTIERVPDKMGFTVRGAPAGAGMLNIPELIALCREAPKCSTATLELWMNQNGTVSETIEREKYWVEESISYLKNYLQ